MLKQLPFALCLSVFATAPMLAMPVVAQAPKPPVPQQQPQQQQPASSVVKLTLQDLPPGFQELPPEFKSVLASQLAAFQPAVPGTSQLPLENVFAFVNSQNFEVVFGFTDKLPSQTQPASFDEGLQQLQQPQVMAKLMDTLKQRLKKLPGFELVDHQVIPPQKNLGNAAAGFTVAMKMSNLPEPLRMDITLFRRGNLIAATGVGYMDKTKPVVSINDAASKLDARIVKSE
jgi:hypothetical protein